MLYFAYGSNMNETRMKTRKTGYEFRAAGTLKEYALRFNKKATYGATATNTSLYPNMTNVSVGKMLWDSKTTFVGTAIKRSAKFCDPEEGYASVVPCKGSEVQGALYVIPENGLKELDKHEGCPTHYYRELVPVVCANGAVVQAIAYIAAKAKISDNLLPSDAYLGHLLKGIDVMTDEYFQELAKQKTMTEYSAGGSKSTWNKGTSTATDKDRFYDDDDQFYDDYSTAPYNRNRSFNRGQYR